MMDPVMRHSLAFQDARHFQILALTLLLAIGNGGFQFEVSIATIVTILGTALLTQWGCSRWIARIPFDPRSSLITGLSLCLLLKTSALWIAALTAVLAIGSKFLLRIRGRHFLNPANFAIVAVLLLTEEAWVSPGQWGSALWLGFLLTCLAGLVLMRSRSADISLAFLGCYSLALLGRASWLGDPWTIPLHQLQNGALLLFTFFMISDPKTIPQSRPGRWVFVALVTTLAMGFQFGAYNPVGLFYALVLGCFTVPILDWLLPVQVPCPVPLVSSPSQENLGIAQPHPDGSQYPSPGLIHPEVLHPQPSRL